MTSFISNFKVWLIFIVIIAAIEVGVYTYGDVNKITASNHLELSYAETENADNVHYNLKLDMAMDYKPHAIQVGDSSGAYGSYPPTIEEYLNGKRYFNAGFGAPPGYAGHYHTANVLLETIPDVEALVLWTTPLAKPYPYDEQGHILEEKLSNVYNSYKTLFALPSLEYRTEITNLFFYGHMKNYAKDADVHSQALVDKFLKSKGWIDVQDTVSPPWPPKTGMCEFHDWFQLSARGDVPIDSFYKYLEKIAQLARKHKVRFAVMFNPVACQNGDKIDILNIRREIARFRQDYPEVVFPFPLITTWPVERFYDPWHVFAKHAITNSHRAGPEVNQLLSNPDYLGVKAESVAEIDAKIAKLLEEPDAPESCKNAQAPTEESAMHFTNCYGIDFVTIPAGQFVKGNCKRGWNCPKKEAVFRGVVRDNEFAGITIDIDYNFQMMKYPVTVRQFKEFAKYYRGSDKHLPAQSVDSYPKFDEQNQGDESKPVTMVFWQTAQSFADWMNLIKPEWDKGHYRLPTESEWEYVARGLHNSQYWWGDDPGYNLMDCVGCSDRTGKDRLPVGQFPASYHGVYDLHGGAWEWMEDCYQENHSIWGARDGSANVWPNCRLRTIRGGGFDVPAAHNRATVRLFDNEVHQKANPSIGFRLIRELPEKYQHVPVQPLYGSPDKAIPIASSGNPAAAFDSNKETFWLAADKAEKPMWIGLGYDKKISLERIEIEQPADALYAATHVLIQYQEKNDGAWKTFRRWDVTKTKPFGITEIKGAPCASSWRLVDDSQEKSADYQWAPLEVRFYGNRLPSRVECQS